MSASAWPLPPLVRIYSSSTGAHISFLPWCAYTLPPLVRIYPSSPGAHISFLPWCAYILPHLVRIYPSSPGARISFLPWCAYILPPLVRSYPSSPGAHICTFCYTAFLQIDDKLDIVATCTVLRRVAKIFIDSKNFHRAEVLIRHAVSLARWYYGPDHPGRREGERERERERERGGIEYAVYVYCILYTVQCIVYSVLCKVYTYSVHCIILLVACMFGLNEYYRQLIKQSPFPHFPVFPSS